MPLGYSAGSERELEYDDFVILETNISCEGFQTLVSPLSERKNLNVVDYNIDFSEYALFSEIAYSFPGSDNFISAWSSGDIERFGLRWPSKKFVIRSTKYEGLPNIPFTIWVQNVVPICQSILCAMENEFPAPGFPILRTI